MSRSIHTHYDQVSYHCGVQTIIQIQSFSQNQPVGRIHGSNPWVWRKNIAGQRDQTRDTTCSHGPFGA